MTQPNHVFISYVHEDYEMVERLARRLQESGIRIWLDRNDIAPGARWKRVIKRAISDGGFFLACFSLNCTKRSLTYMNEELIHAVEMLRKMPPDRCWFIPVLLTDCEVPDLDITTSETLRDLQQIILYQDWEAGIRKIVSLVNRESSRETLMRTEFRSEDMQSVVVLFLAASPVNVEPLDLSEELREIQGAIMGSQSRDRFKLVSWMSLSPRSLPEAILSSQPQIIHFSGHGSAERGLIVEAEDKHSTVVGWEALGRAISALANKVECIIFNANGSQNAFQFISQKVPYIISTGPSISDAAAIAFSAGFYQALGNGREIVEAFDIGCAQISLEGFSEDAEPVLHCNGRKAKRRTLASTGRPASPPAR